ncbi:MAG TPA: hypothetical protein VHB78_00030 [Vicinamibacterales bacterium]|nr:hypothetical protein [Vicinamibacterales bacterium]
MTSTRHAAGYAVLLVSALLTTASTVRVAAQTPSASAISATDFAAMTWRAIEPSSADGATAPVDVRHASVDAAFPYRICGVDANEDGFCVSSRGNDAGETASVEAIPISRPGQLIADPQEPDLIYGGALSRYDRRTGQVQLIGPRDVGADRTVVAFSTDGRTIYAAGRGVWKSTNSGLDWTAIGSSTSGAVGLAVSRLDSRLVWLAARDGTVRLTHDGGTTWSAPVSVVLPGGTIATIEASHFDPNSAYVVVSRSPSGAHILRTRDAGATWQPIVAGLDRASAVFVMREDPSRRGMLFAGTDQSIFVSFDDGETWQAWRSNLPQTSVRDVVIRESAMIAATGGRGLWVLDDIAPLRQLTPAIANAPAFLFRPSPAWRMRGTASAASREDAIAPDDAASLFYWIGAETIAGPASLEIIETATADVIRRFDLTNGGGTSPGLHRIAWDLRYAPPSNSPEDRGPRVLPSTYQVRLTVNGRPLRQAIVVRMDPRMRVAPADLAAQLTLARNLSTAIGTLDQRLPDLDASQRAVANDVLSALRDVARRVLETDARPTPRLDANAAIAIARASAIVTPVTVSSQ